MGRDGKSLRTCDTPCSGTIGEETPMDLSGGMGTCSRHGRPGGSKARRGYIEPST